MSLTPELDDYLYSQGLQPVRCPRLLNLDVVAPSRNGGVGLPTQYSVRQLQCVLELGHARPHDWGSP